MIEVDSGDYFVGANSQEALHRAEAVHPDKAFCLIRIGYKAVRKLRGGFKGSGLVLTHFRKFRPPIKRQMLDYKTWPLFSLFSPSATKSASRQISG